MTTAERGPESRKVVLGVPIWCHRQLLFYIVHRCPMHVLFLFTVTALISTTFSFPTPTTLIQTKLGSIKANLFPTILEALSIPFAVQPIKQLRFKPPQPNTTGWRPNVLDATAFGPMCPQVGATLPTSEACLQLNIWSPAPPITPPPPPPDLRPVLVFVFGGGLTSGSGIQYNGSTLAGLGDIVVVTINYRLGALGFYASEEVAQDNTLHTTGAMNGVLDVVMGLQWVQEHITSFGGDPSRVTVAGESSGAMNTCLLGYSPQAQGLFHQLIIESGACTGPWFGTEWSRHNSFNVSHTFAKGILPPAHLDTKNHDECRSTLCQLRRLPVATIVNNVNFGTMNYGLDGHFMLKRPRDSTMLFAGSVLMGGNSGDTTCRSAGSVPSAPSDSKGLSTILKEYFPNAWQLVLNQYTIPETGTSGALNYPEMFYNMSRDAGVTCPTLWLAQRLMHQNADRRIYLYEFAFNSTHPGLAVRHGGELAPVFQHNVGGESPLSGIGNTTLARTQSKQVGELWTSFVSQGQPSSSSQALDWESFGSTHKNFMYMSPSGEVFNSFDQVEKKDVIESYNDMGHCDFWKSYVHGGHAEQKNFDNFGYLC